LDAEQAAALLVGKQRVDILVDAAGHTRADAIDLEGVFGVRFELERADRRVGEIEVLADAATPVAANGTPAGWLCVTLDDVLQDVVPVSNAHTCGWVSVGLCSSVRLSAAGPTLNCYSTGTPVSARCPPYVSDRFKY
jgi:hypothetical protein